MIDIEVIDDARYGVITKNGRAWKLLKAINSMVVMKRLANIEGNLEPITSKELFRACESFNFRPTVHDMNVLRFFDIIKIGKKTGNIFDDWNLPISTFEESTFLVTDVGREALEELKAGADEIMVPL